MKDGRYSLPSCSHFCFCHTEFFSGEKSVGNTYRSGHETMQKGQYCMWYIYFSKKCSSIYFIRDCLSVYIGCAV